MKKLLMILALVASSAQATPSCIAEFSNMHVNLQHALAVRINSSHVISITMPFGDGWRYASIPIEFPNAEIAKARYATLVAQWKDCIK
jgi:hypothetical protein